MGQIQSNANGTDSVKLCSDSPDGETEEDQAELCSRRIGAEQTI